MTDLSSFSPEETEMLVKMPYKAGLWVSYADDEEGDTDDEKEIEALEKTIEKVMELHAGNALIQQVMGQTLARKSEWGGWEDGVFQVPAQAGQLAGIIRSKAGADALKSYRAAIMEIAAAVARASGEFNSFDEGEQEKPGFFAGLVGKVVDGFSSLSPDDEGHPMNVSAAEDAALAELSQAFKIDDE